MGDKKGLSLEASMLVLFLVFLILRITGAISWRWYAVATPIWIILTSWIFLGILLGLSEVASSRRYAFDMPLPNTRELREALRLECSAEQLKSDKYAKSILSEINRIDRCDKKNKSNIRKLNKRWR